MLKSYLAPAFPAGRQVLLFKLLPDNLSNGKDVEIVKGVDVDEWQIY